LWYYGTAVWILFIIGISKAKYRERFWLIGLLIGAMLWQIIFREHAMIHDFTFLHFGFAIFFGAVIGFISLWNNKKKYLKVIAVFLLLGALLRLPLGAEISTNPVALNVYGKVIHSTDSATLGKILYFIRRSPRNYLEKEIIINELAKRNNVETNLRFYTFIFNDLKWSLWQTSYYIKFSKRNIPQNLIPKNPSVIIKNYVDTNYDGVHWDTLKDNIIGPAINISGQVNKIKYALLLAYILLV